MVRFYYKMFSTIIIQYGNVIISGAIPVLRMCCMVMSNIIRICQRAI